MFNPFNPKAVFDMSFLIQKDSVAGCTNAWKHTSPYCVWVFAMPLSCVSCVSCNALPTSLNKRASKCVSGVPPGRSKASNGNCSLPVVRLDSERWQLALQADLLAWHFSVLCQSKWL